VIGAKIRAEAARSAALVVLVKNIFARVPPFAAFAASPKKLRILGEKTEQARLRRACP